MKKLLLVFFVFSLIVLTLLQLAGGIDFSLPEATPPYLEIKPSPDVSRSPMPTEQPTLDIEATIRAADDLRFISTATAQAKQTEAMAVETERAWEIVRWTAQASDLQNTSTAAAQATVEKITATVIARSQEQEARLDQIRPIWDWGLVIVCSVMLYVFVLAMRYFIPAAAARLAPHPDYVAVPIQKDDDSAGYDNSEIPEFKVTITNVSGGGYQSRNFMLPCSPDVWVEFCSGLEETNYSDFTEETWVTLDKNDPKLFSYRKYVKLRDVLIEQELIAKISSTNSRSSYTATAEGKIVFSRGANSRFDGIDFELTPLPRS